MILYDKHWLLIYTFLMFGAGALFVLAIDWVMG